MKHIRSRMDHHVHTGWHELIHWLYNPAALGRKAYRVRHGWLHRIHLIPAAWMNRACDNYDRRLGLTDDEIRRVQPTDPA